MCINQVIIPFKEFQGNKLYFTKLRPYDGPVPLVLYPDMTILHLLDGYVVDINREYFIIDEVKYLDNIYDIKTFVDKFPTVLYLNETGFN